jgi:hypothetical protein
MPLRRKRLWVCCIVRIGLNAGTIRRQRQFAAFLPGAVGDFAHVTLLTIFRGLPPILRCLAFSSACHESPPLRIKPLHKAGAIQVPQPWPARVKILGAWTLLCCFEILSFT